MLIVYYSGVSEYTKRFVDKVGLPALRIPLEGSAPLLEVEEPFLLITPTYATSKRAVPPQVVKFLNHEGNRSLLRGVVGGGYKNFNSLYAAAAKIVSEKCSVPFLHSYELLGEERDVLAVRAAVAHLQALEEGRNLLPLESSPGGMKVPA